MSAIPIRKPSHAERCADNHRRIERAVHLDALRRDVAKPREHAGLPEDVWIPPTPGAAQDALIRACLGMLKAHRDELDAMRERLAAVEEKTA